MAGYENMGEIEGASDGTTATVINRPLSSSQRAVDDRFRALAPELAGTAPDAIAAAIAAIDTAIQGKNLLEVTRGSLPDGVDANSVYGASNAGSWRAVPGRTYTNLPVTPVTEESVVNLIITDQGYAQVQTFTTGGETWFRKSLTASGSTVTWAKWRRLATAEMTPIPPAAKAILDLAREDGWLAVYDPTNWATRRDRLDRIYSIQDGLGNLPPLTQDSNPTAPLYEAGKFGQLDAGNYGTPQATWLSMPALSSPKSQPMFVMTLAQSRLAGGGGFTRHFIDGVVSERVGIVQAASTGYQVIGGATKNVGGTTSDLDPHLFGTLFHGDQSRMFIDGQEYPLSPVTQPSFVSRFTGLRLGNRFEGVSNAFAGWIGVTLVYEGIPSDEVRERMSRLILSLSKPGGYVADRLHSQGALLKSRGGQVAFQKSAQTPRITASTIKSFTAYLTRQTITDARLDELVTVREEHGLGVNGPYTRLNAGDQISYRGLITLMMLESNNIAARVLSWEVGAQLSGTGTGRERFVAAGQALLTSWGWTTARYVEPAGLDYGNRLSPTHLADLLLKIYTEDTWLLGIMGTYEADVPVTGPQARTITALHNGMPTYAPIIPGLIGTKGGTLLGVGGNTSSIYQDGAGEIWVLVTMIANPIDSRVDDVDRLMTGDVAVLRSAQMMLVDAAAAQNLRDSGSLMRAELDHLYQVRAGTDEPVDIDGRMPGVDMSWPGSKITLQRRGDVVELTIAGTRMPAGAVFEDAIPEGFRPVQYAYGTVSADRGTSGYRDIDVRSTGAITVYGNDPSEVLRGTLTWVTGETWNPTP